MLEFFTFVLISIQEMIIWLLDKFRLLIARAAEWLIDYIEGSEPH